MPKVSPEFAAGRKTEIIDACKKLFQTMNFRQITLKEIGKETSFSRPSIYNYFHTKEEIFLALFEREYALWTADLDTLLRQHDSMTKPELADGLARSLEKRGDLLKLLSKNLYDMEENSRLETLTSFKTEFKNSMNAVHALLDKFCPEMDEQEKQDFLYMFFPFVYGIYPYTAVTEKQKDAMERAGMHYSYQSVHEICYKFLARLLGCAERHS
ncbi:MAG: TetR family transcriptional regulator [Mailhella sp.]|nr:TetR family transcriptional regulator [Mailhella sp.]